MRAVVDLVGIGILRSLLTLPNDMFLAALLVFSFADDKFHAAPPLQPFQACDFSVLMSERVSAAYRNGRYAPGSRYNT